MAFLVRRTKNYFALVFSDQEICLVQVNQKGKVVLSSKVGLEPGIIERGWVKDSEKLTEVLQKLLTSQKIKTKFVAVGLSEAAAFSRVLTLPNLHLEELDDAARWESEPLLPMSQDLAYLDWRILAKGEKETQVLVMALPTKLVEGYAEILESLDFQPVAFEPTSLSLARLIEKEKETGLVIEVKPSGAVLVVVGNDGGIELSSTVSFKGEIEKEELFSTVTGLLSFYEKRNKSEKKITKIFLCGPGATQDLAASLKAKTSLETIILKVEPLELASAVSLAKKDIAAPIDEKTINLIPPRIQGVYDLAEKKRLLGGWVKLVLFSLFLILFAFGVAASRVYFELKKIEGEILVFQVAIKPESRETEAYAQVTGAKAAKVISLVDSQEEFVSLLAAIEENQPEGLVLEHYSIDFETGQIVVDGLAEHRDQLLEFRDRLTSSGRFDQVRVPLSSLEKEENVRFTVSLTKGRS